MDALRIILLLIGVSIILTIYFYSRRTGVDLYKNKLLKIIKSLSIQKRNSNNITMPVREPDSRYEVLNEAAINNLAGLVADKHGKPDTLFDTHDEPKIDAKIEMHAMDNADIAIEATENYLLVLNIKSKKGEIFTGAKLLQATKLAGMQFGEHNIFHRHAIVHEKVLKTPVCSLANMFEPGTFNIDDVDSLETSGLVMFMQLPGPVDAATAFDNTLRTAQKLVLELDAKLCDDSHNILTAQTIGLLKEQMSEYDFRQRIQANKQHH